MRTQDVDALREVRESLDAIGATDDGDAMSLMRAKVLLDQVLQRELEHKLKVKLRDQAKVSFDYARGRWVNITDAILDEWTGLYPALCIEIELLRAAGWLLAGKEHRKSNHVQFLQRWLSRDQDRGGRDYSPWLQESQKPEDYLEALRAWCRGERDMPKSVERERKRAWKAAPGTKAYRAGEGDPMDLIPPVSDLPQD